MSGEAFDLEAVATPRASVQAVALCPLDQLLSTTDVYRMRPDQVDDVRSTEIRYTAAFHVKNQPSFARYCERLGFDPETVQGPDDLGRVPLLPSALFKRRDRSVQLRSVAADPHLIQTTSSGTQGSISIVPRDDVTLMRFFASVSSGARDVLGVDDFSMPVLNLGPAPDEAKHLWIAYVLAGAAVFFDSRNYVRAGTLESVRLVAALQRADGPLVLIGPPALLLDACDALPHRLRLDPGSLVVSVGGWKRANARAIDRAAFRARVGGALGLAPSRIRDAYNMVELNSVVFECSERVKHLPPWLHASARDARTLELLGDDQPGILAYLDPTARSYPGFVLSDDFGSVRRNVACGCGLQTDALVIERRINRIESRGCALKMNYSPATDGAAQ